MNTKTKTKTVTMKTGAKKVPAAAGPRGRGRPSVGGLPGRSPKVQASVSMAQLATYRQVGAPALREWLDGLAVELTEGAAARKAARAFAKRQIPLELPVST